MLLKNKKFRRAVRITFIVLEILYWAVVILFNYTSIRNISTTLSTIAPTSFEYRRFLGFDAWFALFTFFVSMLATCLGVVYYAINKRKTWYGKALIALHAIAPIVPLVVMFIALRAHGGV